MTSSRALVMVATGAAAISFAPVFTKGLIGGGMGPSAIATWRTAIAAAVLLGVTLALGRSVRLPRPVRGPVIAAGIAFALDLFVWNWSIVYVGAGMATILGNTQVFWTAALGRVLYGEPLTRRYAAGAVVAFTGVTLLAGVGSDIDISGDYLLGVALGLATGAVYAAYIVALRRANMQWPAEATPDLGPMARGAVALGWTVAVAAAGLALFALGEGDIAPPEGLEQVGLLLGLALGAQVLGWLIISTGLPRVPAARAALVILLQPTLAAIWGALFFGEELTPLQLGGAGLTLAGVYLGSTRRR